MPSDHSVGRSHEDSADSTLGGTGAGVDAPPTALFVLLNESAVGTSPPAAGA
jgi:uncharacterized spore protein YtfJ